MCGGVDDLGGVVDGDNDDNDDGVCVNDDGDDDGDADGDADGDDDCDDYVGDSEHVRHTFTIQSTSTFSLSSSVCS